MKDVAANWDDIPCPAPPHGALDVRVGVEVVEKIIDKHVRNDHAAPWIEWLGADAIRILRSPDAAGVNDAGIHDAKACLRQKIRFGLLRSGRRPLAIRYSVRGKDQLPGSAIRNWLFVLESGAVVVLKSRRKGVEDLTTCFIPDGGPCRERWRATVRRYVDRYSDRAGPGGGLVLRNPKRPVRIDAETRVEVHDNWQYFMPETWGFDERGLWNAAAVPPFELGAAPASGSARRRLNPIRNAGVRP